MFYRRVVGFFFVFLTACGGGGSSTVDGSGVVEGYAIDGYVVGGDFTISSISDGRVLFQGKTSNYGKMEWPASISGVVKIEIKNGTEDEDGDGSTTYDQRPFEGKISAYVDSKLSVINIFGAVNEGIYQYASGDTGKYFSAMGRLPDLLKSLYNVAGDNMSRGDVLSRINSVKNITNRFSFNEIIAELGDDGTINKSASSIDNDAIFGFNKLTNASSIFGEMRDISLLNCVSEDVGKDIDKITSSDLNGLRDLNCVDANVSSLSGIDILSNLKTANLAKNNISDVSPLALLEKLEWVDLYDNKISSINILGNSKSSLINLRIENNCIKNVQSIASFSNLNTLGYNKNINKQYSDCNKNDASILMLQGSENLGKFFLKYRTSFNLGANCQIDWGDEVVESAVCDAWVHTPSHSYSSTKNLTVKFLINGEIAGTVSLYGAKVESIAPGNAILDASTSFTVTGQNLPLTPAMTLGGIPCQIQSSPAPTASGFTAVCTPGGATGSQVVKISDSAGSVIDQSKLISVNASGVKISNSWTLVEFQYLNNYMPVRLNQDSGYFECASSDGLNCFWGKGLETMPAATNPVVCTPSNTSAWQAAASAGVLHWCTQLNDLKNLSWVKNNGNGREYASVRCGTWTQCQSKAIFVGGGLAIMRSQLENSWAVANFGVGYWLGATDHVQEGVWRWVNGDVVQYTNWYPGEPSASYENYLNMWVDYGGRWNDVANDDPKSQFRGLIERVN